MAFKGIGKAVARGVPFTFAWSKLEGTDYAGASDDNKAMSLDYTHDAQHTDHRDGNSAVYGITFDEPTHTITIRAVPTGNATNTVDRARLNAVPPDVGTAVVLAGGPVYFTGGSAIAGSAGSWIYKGGGSVSYTPDGPVEITMPLYRHGFSVEAPTSFATVQDM